FVAITGLESSGIGGVGVAKTDYSTLHNKRDNARYIAAANPSTVLALIARVRSAEQRHIAFMVEGGPVVMKTDYDAVVAERDALRAQLAQVDDHHHADRERQARTPEESIRFINSDHPCCLPIGDVCQITVAYGALREAAQALPLDSFDEDMSKIDAAEFVDHAGEFFEAMAKARAAL